MKKKRLSCSRLPRSWSIGEGLGGQDVPATLERLRFERGLPQRIYCDNGTEFVSAAMDLWAYINCVSLGLQSPPHAERDDLIIQRPFLEECLSPREFARRGLTTAADSPP